MHIQIKTHMYINLMGLYLNLPSTSSLSSQHTPEIGDLPGGTKGRWVGGG